MRALTHVAEQPARTAHVCLTGASASTYYDRTSLEPVFRRARRSFSSINKRLPPLLRAFELSSTPDGAPEYSNATEHWVTIWVLPYGRPDQVRVTRLAIVRLHLRSLDSNRLA